MPNTVQIVSNAAPFSLGMVVNVQYDENHHPESAFAHSFIDHNEGIRRVPQTTWFIIKVRLALSKSPLIAHVPHLLTSLLFSFLSSFLPQGTDLNRHDKIRFPCYHDISLDYEPGDLVFRDELFESCDALPPQFPWEGSNLRRKCVVRSDFSSLDRSQLVRREEADGSGYYSVHYELVVTIQSPGMIFAVEWAGLSFGKAYVDFQ